MTEALEASLGISEISTSPDDSAAEAQASMPLLPCLFGAVVK